MMIIFLKAAAIITAATISLVGTGKAYCWTTNDAYPCPKRTVMEYMADTTAELVAAPVAAVAGPVFDAPLAFCASEVGVWYEHLVHRESPLSLSEHLQDPRGRIAANGSRTETIRQREFRIESEHKCEKLKNETAAGKTAWCDMRDAHANSRYEQYINTKFSGKWFAIRYTYVIVIAGILTKYEFLSKFFIAAVWQLILEVSGVVTIPLLQIVAIHWPKEQKQPISLSVWDKHFLLLPTCCYFIASCIYLAGLCIKAAWKAQGFVPDSEERARIASKLSSFSEYFPVGSPSAPPLVEGGSHKRLGASLSVTVALCKHWASEQAFAWNLLNPEKARNASAEADKMYETVLARNAAGYCFARPGNAPANKNPTAIEARLSINYLNWDFTPRYVLKNSTECVTFTAAELATLHLAPIGPLMSVNARPGLDEYARCTSFTAVPQKDIVQMLKPKDTCDKDAKLNAAEKEAADTKQQLLLQQKAQEQQSDKMAAMEKRMEEMTARLARAEPQPASPQQNGPPEPQSRGASQHPIRGSHSPPPASRSASQTQSLFPPQQQQQQQQRQQRKSE